MKRLILSLTLLTAIGIYPSAVACKDYAGELLTLEVPQQAQEDLKTMPEYIDGQEALLKHINQNIKYPPSAVEKEIQGICLISFTVTAKGTIAGVHVTKSLDEAMDKEAIRVVKSIPGKWKPGVNKSGKKVATKFTIPIHFRLN